MLPVKPSRGESLSCREILKLSRSGACASSPLTLAEAWAAVRNIPRGSTPKYGNSAGESSSGSVAIDRRFSPTSWQTDATDTQTQQRHGTGLSTPASQSGPHSGTFHPSPKSRSSLVYPAQPFEKPQSQPEGPPPPMDEMLAKTLDFLTISHHAWRAFEKSSQVTCIAMRVKVYTKLRSLGMSYGRVAEVTGHDKSTIRHVFGRAPRKITEKNIKPGGRINPKTERENASAPQGEVRTEPEPERNNP